ncbi:MAG: hypothetical protein SNH94_05925 [Rikenellaceae bacterium]
MKKLIFTVAFAAMAFVGAQSASAQKLSLGFEGDKEWWIQPKYRESVLITSEKAAEGQKSLKIDCKDFGEENSVTAQMIKETHQIISPAGVYTITLKVFLPENPPLGISTPIKDNASDYFQPISWKLKGVEKGKWVELSQEIELKELEAGVMSVTLFANPKWGGVGCIYVDDIKINKK